VFASSQPFLLYDYLRVPYTVDAALVQSARCPTPAARWGRIVASNAATGPCLSWPLFREGQLSPAGALEPRRLRLRDVVLHGRVMPDETLRPVLDGSSQRWTAVEAVHMDGGRCASVWRSSTGDIVLPFDPDEVITGYWTERYVDLAAATAASRLRSGLKTTYYAMRPLLPRSVQIALRRAYSHVQRRTVFPRWPVDLSLHRLYDLLLTWSAAVADAEVPRLALWPAGHRWALVLTHDVETASGLANLPVLRDIEQRLGYRSSWNFVPGRYRVDQSLVQRLWDEGFEVGLHGLRHDGRDLDPRQLPRRLPQMRRYADAWGAVGFRAPATQRDWNTMSQLPFRYDSSYPDSDPFEPQPGGCCSWLPFINGEVVELPITLPQDHTLFVILRARDGRPWLDKAEQIKSVGGMALLLTHPDYVVHPPLTAAYEQVLSHFADDPDVWRALPAAVADWWRRRAASSLVRNGAGWRVVGPAADEASVDLTDPPTCAARESRVE
jgi:peptidoglycan/xylan/chitin deacetylase (PgdA/CDA1 family)